MKRIYASFPIRFFAHYYPITKVRGLDIDTTYFNYVTQNKLYIMDRSLGLNKDNAIAKRANAAANRRNGRAGFPKSAYSYDSGVVSCCEELKQFAIRNSQ